MFIKHKYEEMQFTRIFQQTFQSNFTMSWSDPDPMVKISELLTLLEGTRLKKGFEMVLFVGSRRWSASCSLFSTLQ
jgi:hypothetical protein